LVVEIDGSQHADAEHAGSDAVRSAYLTSSGWTVLRFWNDDVIRDIDNVCQRIVIVAGLAGAEMPAKGPAGEPAREAVP
jgi:very-short-patch-repair endonuclease